jgi:hypothetical protein
VFQIAGHFGDIRDDRRSNKLTKVAASAVALRHRIKESVGGKAEADAVRIHDERVSPGGIGETRA